MKNTMIGRVAVVVTTIITAGSAFAGNVCTWKGGSGKFSDANWDTVPVSGDDTIVFDTTNGDAITVENDIADDFSVAKVRFVTKDKGVGACGKLTLIGKRLYVSGSAANNVVVWDLSDTSSANMRGPEVVVDMPIRFKGGRIYVSNKHTFNDKVTIDDNGSVSLNWPIKYTSSVPMIYFMDEVYGPAATILNAGGDGGAEATHVYYKGKVTVATFNVNPWNRCQARLQYSENSIATVNVMYARLWLEASPCLGTNTVITMTGNDGGAITYVTGSDVVCDRVIGADLTKHQTVCDNDASGKLTMKASANASSGVKFTQKLSIVWDPQGAYTNTLVDSASTTTGSLEIKGGTFKMTGTTAFSGVSEVIVRSGATLDLSECTAATPFATTAVLTVDYGGSVILPSEKVVTFASGTYRGLPIVAGSYSSDFVSGGTVHITTGALEEGVSYWANPTSSDWNMAANWLPTGVPDSSSEVRIIVQGADDYTVRMTGAETKPAKIVIGTGLAAKAMLSIVGEANFTKDTKIDVNKGGEIVVPSGGRFIYDMAGNATATERLVQITDGRFVVDGGYATLTNMLGVTVVSGADGEMLVENGGELVLADISGSTTGPLTIEDGGTLRMTDGSISIPTKNWNSVIKNDGGNLDFSGGVFKLSKDTQTNQLRFSGDTTFSHSAQWNNSGDVRITVAPNVDNGKMTFSATGDATATGKELTFITIGGKFSNKGDGSDTTFLWGATGSLTTGPAFVGTSKGTGRFCQTNGFVSVGNYGMCVGNSGGLTWSGGSDAADNASEGIVDVSGGTLSVSGIGAVQQNWDSAKSASSPHGTVLGYGGTQNPPASGRPYVGRMTISGTGSFTNETGHLFIGVTPYGEGSLVVTGGVLRSGLSLSSYPAYAERIGCAVGVGGGKGEFKIYDGDCAISNNVWIGGVDTNSVRILADGEKAGCATYCYPFGVHGGEGLLEVSGGSVAFGRDLVVGSEGTGVVSVVGSQASQFTVARNMVLSNEAAFVEGGAETATLKFKADAGGVTPIAVGGKFVVAPEARLEVDVSDFDIENASQPLQLMSYSSIEGGFDGSRISLTGCPPGKASVRVGTRGISVRKPSGMIMTFR